MSRHTSYRSAVGIQQRIHELLEAIHTLSGETLDCFYTDPEKVGQNCADIELAAVEIMEFLSQKEDQ